MFSPSPSRSHSRRHNAVRIASLMALGLLLTGCKNPEEVAKFCNTAASAVTSSQRIFADMQLSCLREVQTRQGFATFKPPIISDPACVEIGRQAEAASAAAKVLSDYFSAIGSLASFGTAKAGRDANDEVAQASASLGSKPTTQAALGSMAQFLVSVSTKGAQAKDLDKDLSKVSGNVVVVTNSLVSLIQDDYIGRLLKSEEEKVSDQYREFAVGGSPELRLLLDNRWHSDEALLQSKRASALALIAALHTVSNGIADLAENTRSHHARDVRGILSPYTNNIQALIPEIQKAL